MSGYCKRQPLRRGAIFGDVAARKARQQIRGRGAQAVGHAQHVAELRDDALLRLRARADSG